MGLVILNHVFLSKSEITKQKDPNTNQTFDLYLRYFDSSQQYDPSFIDQVCSIDKLTSKSLCLLELGEFGKHPYSLDEMKNIFLGAAKSDTIYLDRQSVWVWYVSKVQ